MDEGDFWVIVLRVLELAAVALAYLGGLTALVGLAGVVKPRRRLRIRRRRDGAIVLGAGLGLALLGFALPAPLVRVEAPRTRLDAVMPTYHFHEDQPILDVALRSGFVALGDEPGREIVFGTAL